MTAQTILASNRAVTIVLEVRTDNTKVMPAAYSNWVGGPSMLAYPLGVTVEDNSLLYLSTGAVAGLAYNEVVFSDFFVERSLAAPFTGGGGLSINGLPNAPSFAGLDIFVAGDDLELYARDWENKPFTLYVGYEGDDWANFEVYFTGKTIGHSLINDGIQVDLSLNPTGTDKLFPVNRFDDGRVKPYVFGSVKKISPAAVNPDSGDGLWQFTSGAVNTTDTELSKAPYSLFNPSTGDAYGNIYYQTLNGGEDATDDFPSDHTDGDATIKTLTDYIEITVPDQVGGFPPSESAVVGFLVGSITGSPSGDFNWEIDVALDPSSTIDNWTSAWTSKQTFSKSITTLKGECLVYGSAIYGGGVYCSKQPSGSENSETIIIRVYELRIVPKPISADVQVFMPGDSKALRLPTFRVADATAAPSLPGFIAVYDDNGYLKIANNNTGFLLDAVGDTTNSDLVSACQYISTQANGSDSPITSSITSPTVGVYCDKAKPIVEWWREWCDAVDVYLDVSLTTSTIDLKRRFNNQVFDADGVLNVTESFSFTEDDMLTFKQLPNEPSVSQYEVSYKYNHESPKDSPTATNINPFARLNQVKRIDTVLVNQSDATVVSELNNRDGNRRTFYEFEVAGAGHGLSPNDTGFISHSKIKDGKFTLRFVREYPLQKKTLLKGVKNG